MFKFAVLSIINNIIKCEISKLDNNQYQNKPRISNRRNDVSDERHRFNLKLQAVKKVEAELERKKFQPQQYEA